MGGVLSPTRKFDSVEERNKLAVQLMQSSDVAIDDLYGTAKPIMEKHGRPNDVHFTPEGYQVLAEAVAASIETALTNK
jgi:acyl-CoA thioesterase-1